MGIVSRLFLFIYVIVVIVAIVVISGVCLHIIPTNVWQEKLKFIIVQRETLIVLAVMLFFSLNFLGSIFSSKKDVRKVDEILLKAGEPGEVRVALDAIKSITERAALSVSGVREVAVKIKNQNGDVPIAINLAIVLSQGHAAPVVSEAVITAVNKIIFNSLQMTGVPIDVKVTDITNAMKERRQRVV